MSKQKALLIIVGMFSVILFSCSQNPTAIGSGVLNGDFQSVKTLDSVTDSLKQTSSYFKQSIPLSISSYLFLGKKNNVQGSVLIKFLMTLPDSINQALIANTAQVISSVVTFPGGYFYGDSTATMDFNVYKINNSWNVANYTADNLPSLSYTPTDLSSNRNVTDTLTTFNLSNTLTTQWAIAAADSVDSTIYGIYLLPTANSQKIIGFSNSTSITPQINLKIIIQKTGAYIDTVTLYPLQDVSAISGSLPKVSSEDIVVQAGLEVNSRLWFDLSKIPSGAVINHADLILTPDSTYQLFGNTFYNTLIASMLKDSASALIDSSSSNYYGQLLPLSSGKYFGNIAAIVQHWVSTNSNQGLILEADGNLLGLELYALKGSNAVNIQSRPQLRITYSLRK